MVAMTMMQHLPFSTFVDVMTRFPRREETRNLIAPPLFIGVPLLSSSEDTPARDGVIIVRSFLSKTLSRVHRGKALSR